MDRIKAAWRIGRFLPALLISALASGAAWADREWNFPPPVTPIAHEIYELHAIIFWICVVIFFVVFGAMGYSIYAHRKSKGHVAEQFHENTTVEIIWTVIPFIILVLMAWPATKTVLSMKDASAADLTVKITGSQWKWNYDYMNDGFGYFSELATPYAQIDNREKKNEHYLLEVDRPLVVPVNKKIRLLITSSDVIHAWYLPAAGVQQDAVPGFVRDDWMKFDTTGTYRGQCAKICGKEHGFMPIVVEVKSEQDYAAWVADQKKQLASAAGDVNKTWDIKDLTAQGEKVYTANCVACHQATGKGLPPAFPALDGSKVATGPKLAHISTVLNGVTRDGKPTAMVAWKGTLSDIDIASVVTYERNSWGNHTGEAIQPAEVASARAAAK
ncbi:MAG TPA: cytochrome c oxidase subunit II [Casimicrobiaceae bacterium]|jgi:cytochrome c oxidase subunit 2|nr:cytochrome c oxidase subunit II [Casimicrobiaceae bacterium]